MRPPSHGMFGTSHSCHATIRLSGDQTGSKQKSAVDERRTGHGPSASSDATATCCASTVYATSAPSGDTAGAAAPDDPGAPTTGRLGPPSAGATCNAPSTPACTIDRPSGVQSKTPPS